MGRKAYTINGELFKTKKSLLDKIRMIRDSVDDFESLDQDGFDFMLDMLRLHPSADQKIEAGVASIYVRRHPAYYQSRGFWAIRMDGTHANFSFLKCLEGKRNCLAEFKKVCRWAIDRTTYALKVDFFEIHSNTKCPITKMPMSFLDSCVHHSGENTFDKILIDFIKEEQINVERVKIMYSNTGRDSLADKEIEKKFVSFHNKRAVLRVISKDAHKRLHHSTV